MEAAKRDLIGLDQFDLRFIYDNIDRHEQNSITPTDIVLLLEYYLMIADKTTSDCWRRTYPTF